MARKTVTFEAMADAAGPITLDEYRARVRALKKLADAVGALADDASLTDAVEVIGPAVEKLADRLATALACSARLFMKEIARGDVYYVDDIWEALGQYAYSAGVSTAEAVEPLLKLDWPIEHLHKKIADARQAADDVALAEATAALAEVPDTITEYERELPPGDEPPASYPIPLHR